MKKYPLEILNVGDDSFMLMSWGHHNLEEFYAEVKENWPDWPMMKPTHAWYAKHPKKGYSWAASPCSKNHPKALPATVSEEGYEPSPADKDEK